jgi:uncharacterized protein (TIGR02001 family)
MNKKLIAVLLAACSAGILQVNAQTGTMPAPAAATMAAPTPPAAPSWSESFSPTYVSQYMFRGSRFAQDSIQGAYDATYGNWDFGVWASNPIGHNKVAPGQSQPEIDPYGSYTWALTDSLSIQPGFTWYTYIHAPTNQGFYRETFEPNIALNWTIGGLKIQPKIYDDLVLEGPTYELNGYYTVPLKDWGTELDFTGTVGTYFQYDAVNLSVPHTHSYGNYWLAGVAAPYQITKDLKATVGWAYTQGSSAYFKQKGFKRVKNTEAQGKGVVSVGLTYSW